MIISSEKLSITPLQDLFYRCQFAAVLYELERDEYRLDPSDAEILLLKVNALFELHRVDEAKAALQTFEEKYGSEQASYLYALGQMSYFDGQMQEARDLFEEALEFTTNERYQFRSLLGVANTYYQQGEWQRIPPIIEQLRRFEPLPWDDDRISLLLFCGNFYLASESKEVLASCYFKKALAASASRAWTYFIERSLYSLAMFYEKQNQETELLSTLGILQSFIDGSEQEFFSYIINDSFKKRFTINTPIDFDMTQKRIVMKNKCLSLEDKPLLFQLLWLLHQQADFVSLENITKDLWPDETYNLEVHNQRITDLATQTRQLIETYANQPVILLSAEHGYKLAST